MKLHPQKGQDKSIATDHANNWRQGSILPRAAAVELQVLPAGSESGFAMVISHDCDCVSDDERERYVECIVGREVEKLDGNNTYGKNPRKLHLELSQCGKRVELSISPKTTVEKRALLSHNPDPKWTISADEKTVLVRWLASRYNRPTFPNSLVERLRAVNDAFRKASKAHADRIIGVFVDFEPNGELHSRDEPYTIGFSVVYEGTKKDAASSSSKLSQDLSSIFTKQYRQANGTWKEIELVRCDSIADTEFTYFEAMRSQLYKLEDLSLRQTPHKSLPL